MSNQQQQPRSRLHRAAAALRRPSLVAGVLLTLAVALAAVAAFADRAPEPAPVSLSQLEATIAGGSAVTVQIDDRRHVATVDSDAGLVASAYPEGYGAALTRRALQHGAEVEVAGATPVSPLGIALRVGVALFVLLAAALLVRERVTSSGFAGGRGRQAEVPDATFSDVAGAEEAAAELAEVVGYLKDPDRFAHLGARPPRGVLLVGPPGTGKTLLARAVAGEAGVPFFALSGSDFVEKFVGVGASRVRNVFDRARKTGRAIVFIDELDAVGKRRGASANANDERENTLNQLLVEMDGFARSEVVVLAATNRPDILDTALTRPGRFDRQISVLPPDRAGREAILRLYLADRPTDGLDVAALSRRTPGFTGADLANLVNQGALVAARGESPAIEQAHLEEAIATVMLGPERRSVEVLQRDREITAWHEAGHAVAALCIPEMPDPAGVTIVPRGHAGGVTWMDGDDHVFLQAPRALGQLTVAMAGRAAEELVFGAAYTQGASGDLRSATDLATRMAAEYGMSSLVGPVHIPEEQRDTGEAADLLRRAVREMLAEALDRARGVIQAERVLLEAVADALLDAESLDAEQLAALREAAAAA